MLLRMTHSTIVSSSITYATVSARAIPYKTRLKELGGVVPDRIHTPRSQERILSQIPWMRGQKAGKKLYIACDTEIGKAAARELHQSPDQDARNMACTAIHLREHIFDLQQKFDREFAPKGRHAPSRSVLYCTASHADSLFEVENLDAPPSL